MPLEPEDQRLLTVAEGYAELDMFLDANEHLEHIKPELRHVPDVLAVRLLIYNGLEKWDLMQTVALALTEQEPEEAQWWVSLGFATRRAESIEKAKDILIRALPLHSKDANLHYNLACYECQLGNLHVAKERLQEATTLDAAYRLTALDDVDLEPLWDTFRSN